MGAVKAFMPDEQDEGPADDGDVRQRASAIYRRYLSRYDGEVQGCCPVIAADIMAEIGGEAVAGYLCFGGVERPHWWVEYSGITLDPMGDDQMSHESYWERREAHRDQGQFAAILPRYEQWRV